MNKTTELERVQQRREQVITQMLAVRSAVRGALSKQFVKVKHKDKKEPVVRGPYYVLCRSDGGRTRSQRVARDKVGQVREDVDNYKHLEALFGEFAELTERLGELEREAAASEEAVKKGLKSRSSRAGRSSG